MLLDELADVVDRAGGLRTAHQEQVLAVARDAVHRRAQARVVGHLGVRLALGHPGPEDLLADVLDLDRAGLVRKVGERRFHRDQPVEQVLLVVLEADVQDVGLAARGDVARHLEGHRRLAGALRAADQQELAGAQAEADRLVERREAERDRLVLRDLTGRDLVVEVDQDIERRSGPQAAVGGVELPRRRGRGGRARGGRGLRSAWLVSVVTASGASVLTRLDPPGWLRRRIVAPTFGPNTHPNVPFPHRPRGALSARQIDQFVQHPGDGPDARLVIAQVHPLVGRVGVLVGWREAHAARPGGRGSRRSWRRPGSTRLRGCRPAPGRTSPRAHARRPASPDGPSASGSAGRHRGTGRSS